MLNNQFIHMREHVAQDKDNEKTIECGGNGGGESVGILHQKYIVQTKKLLRHQCTGNSRIKELCLKFGDSFFK